MSENSVTRTGDDANRDAELESVIADYIRACDAGATPDQRVILERYPELAADLRDFFAQRDRMNQLAGPMRGFGESLLPSVGPGKHISYVGDYELLEEVARGGMGVVYKARQKTLGRIVAVKMMLTGRLANEDDVKRFQIEAQAAASLQHPNIVPIHEVGQHEGLHYFSMDFVEGRSLSAVLRENVLPAKQAASYVRQMAEAIHYAHQQGTLHRDLKPSNVLIDNRDQVRITDFGLAMRVEGDSGLTQTGQIVGTPSYMPPEQAQGKRSLIGPGSDVYSLGAILYECLTGRAPFRADSVMKTIEQVIHREAASPRLLNPGVARDLETICLKCLEKEPHRRYGTAQLLADDLQSYLDDRPILARPVSTIERTWRWCRRNPAVASLLATVAVCLIVGTAVSSYFAIEASNRAKAEAFHRGRADNKATLAERRREESDENARLARRHLYVSQMNLTQTTWEAARFTQTMRLLDLYRPAAVRKVGTDDFRSFEWFYWDRLAHCHLLSFEGHTRRVKSVAVSPNGKLLASASDDLTVKVWDLTSGQERFTLKGHTNTVRSVAFSADGTRLATASEDSTLKVWDTTSGEESLTLKGHRSYVTSVAFSPDGKWLASASADQSVKVWDATSGVALLTLKGHTSAVTSVAFDVDGKRLASASARGDLTVRVWDATTGQETLALKGHTAAVYGVAFSPEGKRLASASLDQTVKVWDATSGQETLTLKGHTGAVNCVAISADGKRLASASYDHTVKVWDTTSGQEMLTLKGHTGAVESVAFITDGQRLASASSDRTVKVWDATSGQETLTLKGHSGNVTSVAFSADAKRLASASSDTTVKVWDVTSGQETLTLKGHIGGVNSVAFSPDGKRLASAAGPNFVPSPPELKVWDIASGQETLTLKGHSNRVTSVAFSSDGKRLASASFDRTVKVWDATSGQETLTLKGHSGTVNRVAFSPDGKRLASASSDQTVKVWDTTSGQETLTLGRHDAGAASVAFSVDGLRLASGSMAGGNLMVWDATSGLLMVSLKGHSGSVHSVAFSPDGKRLASASNDRTVKIWDVTTGQEVLTLDGSSACVAFSMDGNRLASARNDQTVKVWDARPWTPELRTEQQALGRIRFLRAKPLAKPALLDAIGGDDTISEPVRQRALELAREWRE